jgi:hypothetical protein
MLIPNYIKVSGGLMSGDLTGFEQEAQHLTVKLNAKLG